MDDMRSSLSLSGGLPLEREQVYAAAPAIPGTRDAVNVWLEEEQGGFGMRIGVEAATPDWANHEIWLDIAFADGRVFSLRDKGEAHAPIGPEGLPTILGAGPLEFRCLSPFGRWIARFDGIAHETSAQDLMGGAIAAGAPQHTVSFAIEMDMAVPPWVPGALLPEARAILQGEEGAFMSPRYEQLFRASGTLTIDGETRGFNATGLRIRRQGYRKFDGFWGHCWQSALFPSGRAFGYNIYPPRPDGKPSFAEGFIFDGGGVLKPARVIQAPWLTKLRPFGDDVPLVLETDEGCISIGGRAFVNTRSRSSAILPPDFPIVQQAHVRYEWDGEVSYGMMERSSTPDKFVD